MVLDAPTRQQTRQAAAGVFKRGEFQRKLSLADRFVRWLSHLFHFNIRRGPGGSSGSSGGTGLLLYLLLAVLIVLLVWIIVRVVRTWVRTPVTEVETDEEPVVEVPRTQREWRTDAEQAEADGRWKDAVRARYRELVAELVDRRVVLSVPGRTTGELRADVAVNAAAVSASFSEATLLFELPWYADVPTGIEENRRFKQLAVAVLAGATALEPEHIRSRQPVTT